MVISPLRIKREGGVSFLYTFNSRAKLIPATKLTIPVVKRINSIENIFMLMYAPPISILFLCNYNSLSEKIFYTKVKLNESKISFFYNIHSMLFIL